MSKQLSDAPLRPNEQIATSTSGRLLALKKKQPAVFWPWLGGLLVVGLIIVVIVTYSVWNWLNNFQSSIPTGQSSSSVSTMTVQRSAIYADLNFTLVNVQYATAFSDDLIHAGPATVRVTLRVANPTKNAIAIFYYDVARLLVPKQSPIAPTNLNLSAAPQAGGTQTGWIDFPVAKNTALNTLQFQLGSAAINEMIVSIPVSGPYDAGQYNDHLSNQSLTISYNYGPYGGKLLLVYHLKSVDVRDSYNGVEIRAGQQFYVLNFSVDNPNGVTVHPGFGTDYIRLILNSGNRPPMDNTLPDSFKANAQGVAGHVTFVAPAGLHNLSIAFLAQYYQGQDSYPISL